MDVITIVIEAHNEEGHIVDCINAAHLLSKNILVVDMESTDGTAALAARAGATVIPFPHHRYVEPARKFAVETAQTEWVMILDPDERMTPDLAKEIKRIASTDVCTHYRIPRKNIFAHAKWLKHGGWWPDYQLRLIHKPHFRDWPTRIHSTPLIEGDGGFLKHPFLHYFHGNLESMVGKTMLFEDIESELLYKAGRPVTTVTFFRKFMGELWRRIIRKAGFMDGDIGIIESVYQAFSKTITYLYLYEKKNRRTV